MKILSSEREQRFGVCGGVSVSVARSRDESNFRYSRLEKKGPVRAKKFLGATPFSAHAKNRKLLRVLYSCRFTKLLARAWRLEDLNLKRFIHPTVRGQFERGVATLAPAERTDLFVYFYFCSLQLIK